MAHIEWEWIDEGFIEILNEPKLAEVCLDAAERIAYQANSQYETVYEASQWYSNPIGKMKGGRVAAIVGDSGSGAGNELEAQDKALSRAVSACRC